MKKNSPLDWEHATWLAKCFVCSSLKLLLLYFSVASFIALFAFYLFSTLYIVWKSFSTRKQKVIHHIYFVYLDFVCDKSTIEKNLIVEYNNTFWIFQIFRLHIEILVNMPWKKKILTFWVYVNYFVFPIRFSNKLQ